MLKSPLTSVLKRIVNASSIRLCSHYAYLRNLISWSHLWKKEKEIVWNKEKTSKGFSRLMQVSLRLGINHVTHSLHWEWVKVEFRMHSTVEHWNVLLLFIFMRNNEVKLGWSRFLNCVLNDKFDRKSWSCPCLVLADIKA